MRIAVTTSMSGVLVKRTSLNYNGLEKFVEKLEGLILKGDICHK